MKQKFLAPAQPMLSQQEKITDERVWLDVYVALAGAAGVNTNTAKMWADRCVIDFRERFPK